MSSLADPRRSLAVLAGGPVLFALALAGALATLPEWRAGRLPAPAEVEARFRQVAADSGVELGGDGVKLLLSRGFESGPTSPYRTLGAATDDWLLAERRPLFIEATGTGTTADGAPVHLTAALGLDGRPWNLAFTRTGVTGLLTPQWQVGLPTPETALLRDEERLGEPRNGTYKGNAARFYPILGGARPAEVPQYVAESAIENSPATFVARGVGGLDLATGGGSGWWARFWGTLVAGVLLFLGVLLLAFVRALQRRIDFVNAAILAAVATVASVLSALASSSTAVIWIWLGTGGKIVFDALFILLLWATAESLLREAGGEPTNGLDLLRRGRIDRQVGRAVLWGLSAGAVAAAVVLFAHSLPRMVGLFGTAFQPEHSSLHVPPFEAGNTPIDRGFVLAGETLLGLAVARRLLPRKWALPAALGLGALARMTGSQEFASLWTELALALVVVGVLLAAFRHGGSLATLVAGVAAYLFPALAFSALYTSWLGGQVAAASLALLALGAVAFVGLARTEAEVREVAAPAFVARIEEERRVRYEMDLLARMQLGLLPEALPRVQGWEVAARSMLAHEVGGDFYDFLLDEEGGLWIAAGDVAGHGSSCSISHAMAKAALASLVVAAHTPAKVLDEADRVLRRLGTRRVFTSLALLKIAPETGRMLFANAGYPYPLIRADGHPVGAGAAPAEAVREIVLPGLPLGQGPARRYTDVAVELTPGETLLLSSDGLFEARGPDGQPYGFDRIRADLGALEAASAQGLLDALLARWRRTVGTGPLEDDTTVVVVRRAGSSRD